MLTLPKVAADLDHNGRAWFAARFTVSTDPDVSNVVWRSVPSLLDATMRWAEPGEVDTEHVTLDMTAVAELLYASQLDPGDDIDTDALAGLVLAQVNRWHCDLSGPIAVLAQDAGDHPEACARRMSWCVTCAARLLGVSL